MKYVNDHELEARIFHFDGFLLAIFLGAESTPCKQFLPECDKLLASLHNNEGFQPPGGFSVVALNVNENPSETESLGVSAIPTTMLFHKGQTIGKWEGPYSALALAGRIIDAVKKRV
jgi:thioredoxin-like negative regulator of GroEL